MFSPENYTFGLPEIAEHMHINRRQASTTKAQQRLLQKWNLGRERLHSNTKLSQEEISARQLERVGFLVDFVFTTHTFYHKIYKDAGFQRGDIASWNDYNCLPIITKKDILDNYDLFTSNLGQDEIPCVTARTSGSSGQALTVHFDMAMIDHDLMQCLRFIEQMLGRKRLPTDWFYNIYVAAPPHESLDGSYPNFTVSSECPPEAVLKHLLKLKPVVLSGFPTYLSALADLIKSPADLGIEAICTNSEPSTALEREKISQKFGVPVFDEYSSVELCLMATQCREKEYHIVEDNVRIDIRNPDKTGNGEIIVTNLNNTYMPFIRYKQGDIGRIISDNKDCPCGNTFRRLASFMGRSDQILESRMTGKIRSDLIMSLYDRTLLTETAHVGEFQIIQTDLGKIDFLVVPTLGHKHADRSSINSFVMGLQSLFQDPDLAVQIQELKNMPPTPSYKRRLIENRIRP